MGVKVFDRKKDAEQQLDNMSGSELLSELQSVMRNPRYKKNEYTEIMDNILYRRERFGHAPTTRQVNAIKVHLLRHVDLWY